MRPGVVFLWGVRWEIDDGEKVKALQTELAAWKADPDAPEGGEIVIVEKHLPGAARAMQEMTAEYRRLGLHIDKIVVKENLVRPYPENGFWDPKGFSYVVPLWYVVPPLMSPALVALRAAECVLSHELRDFGDDDAEDVPRIDPGSALALVRSALKIMDVGPTKGVSE